MATRQSRQFGTGMNFINVMEFMRAHAEHGIAGALSIRSLWCYSFSWARERIPL